MAERPRHLLLVSHRPLEYGGGGSVRWRFFQRALTERGWAVEVVTARPNITANEFSADQRAARAAAARARVMATAGALARPIARTALRTQPEAFAPSLLWSISGRRAIRGAIARARPDVVVATGPPPAAMFAAAAEAARAGLPLVVELRDLWAGNPYYDAGGSLLRRMEAGPLRHASAVVCVTDSAREQLAALHPEVADRVHVLTNGFDPKLLAMRPGPRPRRDGPATLVHAGAIYGDRSLSALLAALRRPSLAGRVRLELIGPGAADAVAREPGVTVLPPMPWEHAVERVAAADVALVIRTPGDEAAVPGKAYEALALGRPVLALVGPDSELQRLLARVGQDAGCVDAESADAIATGLVSLLDTPPEPVARDKLAPYDRSRIAAELDLLLTRLAGR